MFCFPCFFFFCFDLYLSIIINGQILIEVFLISVKDMKKNIKHEKSKDQRKSENKCLILKDRISKDLTIQQNLMKIQKCQIEFNRSVLKRLIDLSLRLYSHPWAIPCWNDGWSNRWHDFFQIGPNDSATRRPKLRQFRHVSALAGAQPEPFGDLTEVWPIADFQVCKKVVRSCHIFRHRRFAPKAAAIDRRYTARSGDTASAARSGADERNGSRVYCL